MASALLLKALGRPLSNSYLAGDCGASTVAHPKQERPLSTGQLRLGAILATGSCVSFSAARPDLGVMQSDTPTTTLANVPSGSSTDHCTAQNEGRLSDIRAEVDSGP